jgi:hypothetical protein
MYANQSLMRSDLLTQSRFNRVLFGPGLLATMGKFLNLPTHCGSLILGVGYRWTTPQAEKDPQSCFFYCTHEGNGWVHITRGTFFFVEPVCSTNLLRCGLSGVYPCIVLVLHPFTVGLGNSLGTQLQIKSRKGPNWTHCDAFVFGIYLQRVARCRLVKSFPLADNAHSTWKINIRSFHLRARLDHALSNLASHFSHSSHRPQQWRPNTLKKSLGSSTECHEPMFQQVAIIIPWHSVYHLICLSTR